LVPVSKSLKTWIFLGLLAGLAVAAPGAWAGEDRGRAAFDRGDHAAAFKEWSAAAQRSDPAGEYGLGTLLLDGLGTKKDEKMGAFWIRKAAEHGLTDAQVELGLLYGAGRGLPQDYAQAAIWFKRAAEKGDPRAQTHLGYLYQTGQGVEQSDAEALALHRMAAEQGLVEGQLNLGVMYATGHGTPQDYVQGHMWFNLAAAQGDKTAAANRDALAMKMSKIQIEEAQKLASQWQPVPESRNLNAMATVPAEAPAQAEQARTTPAAGAGVSAPKPPASPTAPSAATVLAPAKPAAPAVPAAATPIPVSGGPSQESLEPIAPAAGRNPASSPAHLKKK
jgi:TPR repeat protein